jgi:glucose-6-phosphate-specific signal transduction histidine kinase
MSEELFCKFVSLKLKLWSLPFNATEHVTLYTLLRNLSNVLVKFANKVGVTKIGNIMERRYVREVTITAETAV